MKDHNKLNDFVSKTNDEHSDETNIKTISSRFGTININLNKKIFFYSGLLGVNGSSNFCLSNLPESEKSPFKLLQSVEDDNLSFLILPIVKNIDGIYPFIDQQDIENIYNEFEVSEENLVLILIVNIAQSEGQTQAFVNVRAPLIIDSSKMAGIQHVFQNNKYSIRQELN